MVGGRYLRGKYYFEHIYSSNDTDTYAYYFLNLMFHAVGFLRQDPGIYDCPVYSTTFRGPTYTFLVTLRTLEPTQTWTLAGVALVMEDE